VDHFVSVQSDASILVGLVLELASRSGPLNELRYDPDGDEAHIVGIPEVDRALVQGDPVPGLLRYFQTRWDHDGQEAVIRDLERCLVRLPAGSPLHNGLSEWAARAQTGQRPEYP
jgi:hypothetical protein